MGKLGDEAGEEFRTAAGFGLQDAHIRLFRYHLLRLTTVGLSRHDVEDLRELGRLAFARADLTRQVRTITERGDASPLAVAIATIAGEHINGNSRSAVLGAVLGAYTAVGRGASEEEVSLAITGAIGGAVAMVVGSEVERRLEQADLVEYFSAREA